MTHPYFESWSSIGQTVIAGVCSYAFLLVVLRISGKRTLAKLNAFDLVITVALGSTLASVVTSRSLPLANGLIALALLVLLQFVVSWTTVRSQRITKVVKSDPVTLSQDGALDEQAMKRERLNRDEVESAIRGAGYGNVNLVHEVVFETDGSFSVIPRANARTEEDQSSVRPG